jgi:5-methylcytosine-specific restriction endonuclease McrA
MTNNWKRFLNPLCDYLSTSLSRTASGSGGQLRQKNPKTDPVTGLAMELVRKGTQAMDNPLVVEAENVHLQVEHIVPKASCGSNRISNLTLVCSKCYQKMVSQALTEFLKNKPRTNSENPSPG